MPDHALPQPDTSGEGETVESLTITGLTASRLVQTDGDKALASVADLTSWIAGTSNQVVVGDDGDGTLTLSLPQSIHTGASPTFTGLTLSGLTASRLVSSNGSSALASVADLTTWIAGTSNQVVVGDDGDGTLTLSLPQSIHTSASVTFGDVTAATVRGGTSSGGALALSSTSHATKGYVELDGNVRLYALSHTLIQANGANAQTAYWYGTVDNPLSPTNYERLELTTGTNIDLKTRAAGTGTARNFRLFTIGASELQLGTNGVIRAKFDSSGHGLAFLDNAYDWGDASNRWRTGYFGTSLVVATTGSNDSINTGGNIGVHSSLKSINIRNGNSVTLFGVEFPDATTALQTFRLFRLTNTSGGCNFDIHPGDGAGTHALRLKHDGTSGSVNSITGDLRLQAAGNVRFGTHSAIGAETVTGYITVKDDGGTTRKLAVVS